MKTKKNLFIEATPIVPVRRSGIGHATLEIIRELDKEIYVNDYRVTAFVPLGEGEMLSRYKFKNVVVRQLPFPHKVLSLLTRLRFGLPIDIFLGKGIYIFPNYRNLPLLFSQSLTFIHDVCYKVYPQYIQPRNLLYLQKNMPKWLKRTDKILTISKKSKQEIVRYLQIDPSKVNVVGLGVDRSVFYPRTKQEIDIVRKKNNLYAHDYFLYIGNIEPRKNLSFLIRTYSSDTDLKDTSLFLVGGDGWLNEDIINDIREASAAGFDVRRNKDYIDDEDLPALISGARAVVLPSIHEGFGLSIVQAQACGTPVVASNIEVLKEISGDAIDYFDNGSQGSLLEALKRSLRRKHTKTIIMNHTWLSTVQKIILSIPKRE